MYWFFDEISKSIEYNITDLRNQLEFEKELDISLFVWKYKLTKDEKESIISLFEIFLQKETQNFLDMLDGWLNEIEWYKPYVEYVDYMKLNESWHWWLLNLLDLNDQYLTTWSLSHEFKKYIENNNNKDSIGI